MGPVLRVLPSITARDLGEERTTVPLMAPAPRPDREPSAAPATLDSMALGPPARRSITARMEGTRAVGMPRAPTLALEPTLAAVTRVTAVMGRPARP